MSKIKSILDKEGIAITDTIQNIDSVTALGIGDLLIAFALIKQNLIPKPIVIDLSVFENNTYPNPTNALEFRIKLIKQILISNQLPQSCITYAYSGGRSLNQHQRSLPYLQSWNLIIPDVPKYSINLRRKYIIFHTKYRSIWKKQHDALDKVRRLYGHLKIKNYDIILLGERKMVPTIEQHDHIISTVYPDLLHLRKHNQVIDLTQETIYNSLDINRYIMDCNLIKNATKNILVGFGGQLVTSLIFNQKSVICLRFDEGLVFNEALKENIFTDYKEYKKILKSL